MIVLLYLHSILRWLVVISLLVSIIVAFRGYKKELHFNKKSNLLRHWTATLAHVQLVIGILLAFKSSYFTYFWKNIFVDWVSSESVFYGLIHPTLMFISISLLTIGSAKAKRKGLDSDKFKIMLVYYLGATILILIAVPWPFSPFAQRPLIPTY